MDRTAWAGRPHRESMSKELRSRATRIKARDNFSCVWCGAHERKELMAGRRMHLDHIRARTSGGGHSYRNVIVSCTRCNDVKKKLTEKLWVKAAWEKWRLKIDLAAVKEHARTAYPTLDEAREAQAREYEGIAEDHEKYGQGVKHQVAAKANRAAAEATRGGASWTHPKAKAARKFTEHAWQTGPRGGRYYLADKSGNKVYGKGP